MKNPAAIAACLLLAGCGKWADLDSDAFKQETPGAERFSADSRSCSDRAEIARSYDLKGIQAYESDRHNVYSRAYSDCMTALGYKRRTAWYDFWQDYDW